MQGLLLLGKVGFHIAQRGDQQPGLLFFQLRQFAQQGVDLLPDLGHLFADTRQVVQSVAGHQRLQPLMQTGYQGADRFYIATLLRLVQLHHHGVRIFLQLVRHQIRVTELARLAPEPF
ncbi:hypothetical protein D3C76_1468690 [compost metagenome]